MQVAANGIAIEVDDQGPPGGEPVLLVMGLGMQLVGWPDELVQDLVSRGFRVIRFDNRDAGLSQGFDQAGVPNLAWAAMRWALHLPVEPAYSLQDMAADAFGVMDALGIASAHVVGASMGGMIAQRMAVWRPERLRSLVLMMTTSGSRRLPQADRSLVKLLFSRPVVGDLDGAVAHYQRLFELIGSPAFRPDPVEARRRILAMVGRAWRPAGTARQMVAVAADGDRTPLLPQIRVPTAVIHGREDPLVPAAAGEDLAARIPGATLDLLPGMGHDLPLPLLPHFADVIQRNAARA